MIDRLFEMFLIEKCFSLLLSEDLKESEIIPYQLSQPLGERVIVLAPHPDDETLGCGGTISLLSDKGKKVKVLYLTSGDKADMTNPLCLNYYEKRHINDYSRLREDEAVSALKELGVKDYEFLRFPDRELFFCLDDLYKRVIHEVSKYEADTIYCPSPYELNPDHRATALVCLRLKKSKDLTNVIFYEVTTPFIPDLLIDVTSTFNKKKSALSKYVSQLNLFDYLGHVTALNKLRRLTVPQAEFVEAFGLLQQR